MFGLWTSMYKAVHNSLRLMTPIPAKRPSRRVSEATAAKSIENGTSREVSGDASPIPGGGSGTATPRSGWEEQQGKTGAERAKVRAKQKQRAFMRDPRSKVWHAYVAGAISGLAILAETKDNRIGLAQQLVVR